MMPTLRHPATLAAAFLIAGGAAHAADLEPGEWSASLGAGALIGPEYPGAKSTTVSPIPLVDIAYRADWFLVDTIFLNTRDGLGLVMLRQGAFSFGGSIGYAPGRDEDDAARLHGLGDIDGGARAGLFAEAEFGALGLSLRVDRGLGDIEGTTVTAGAAYLQGLGENLMLVGQIEAVWADDDHMQQWFGIDQGQAARSAYFGRYNAEAGFRDVSISVTALYSLSESWRVSGTAGMSRLLGDAADSPITQRENQPFGMLGLSYSF